MNGKKKTTQGLCIAQFQQFSAMQFVLNVLGFLIYNMVNTGARWFMAQRKTSVFVGKVIILNIYLIFFLDESKGIIYK